MFVALDLLLVINQILIENGAALSGSWSYYHHEMYVLVGSSQIVANECLQPKCKHP